MRRQLDQISAAHDRVMAGPHALKLLAALALLGALLFVLVTL